RTHEVIALYLANGRKPNVCHVTPSFVRGRVSEPWSSGVYTHRIQWTFNQAEGRVVLRVV
ncbi:hypothetical protein E2986_11127, partial [Frieseomelitta varia]